MNAKYWVIFILGVSFFLETPRVSAYTLPPPLSAEDRERLRKVAEENIKKYGVQAPQSTSTRASTATPTTTPTPSPSPTVAMSPTPTLVPVQATDTTSVFTRTWDFLRRYNFFGIRPLALLDTDMEKKRLQNLLTPLGPVQVKQLQHGLPGRIILAYEGEPTTDLTIYHTWFPLCQVLGRSRFSEYEILLENGQQIYCVDARARYAATGSESYAYWPLSFTSPKEVEVFNEFFALQNEGKVQEAIKIGEELVAMHPSAVNLYELGFLYFDIARDLYSGPKSDAALAQSIGYYKKALEADHLFAPAKSSLGNVLFEQSHRNSKESLALYDEAIALDPNWTLAYFNKGLTMSQIGQGKEGYDWVKQGIVKNSKDPNIDYIKRMFVCLGREIGQKESSEFYTTYDINPRDTIPSCPYGYK